MRVIEPLFGGKLDIVGDVHGEIEALEDLLGCLGYDAQGVHADGRRLVFLGDLTDRGPDSPAVLRRVKTMVEAGRAQCIAGNHELNLLRGELKDGNDWWVTPETANPVMRPVSPDDKHEFTAFIESLPLALEREDLRVVHACWNAAALAEIRPRANEFPTIRDAWESFAGQLTRRWSDPELRKRLRHEWRAFAPLQKNPDRRPAFQPTIARMDREYQMNNPVCVLTSGEETETTLPFWAGGKWRMVERVRWWEHYHEPVPVIIGHYWRRFGEACAVYTDQYGPDVFAGIEQHHCMGPQGNVYCVDFSVGGRYAQRAAGEPWPMCRLAAVRIPEWQVVYDHGEQQNIVRGNAVQ